MAKLDSISVVYVKDYIIEDCKSRKVEAYKEYISKLYVRNVLKGSSDHSKSLRIISSDTLSKEDINFLKNLMVKHTSQLLQIVFDENPGQWSPIVKSEKAHEVNEQCFNCGHKFYAENWYTPSACPKCHWSRVN